MVSLHLSLYVFEDAEKYLRETWPVISKALKDQGIKAELDLVSFIDLDSAIYSKTLNGCILKVGLLR